MKKSRKNFRLNPTTAAKLEELKFIFGETEVAVVERLIVAEYARHEAEAAALEAKTRRQEARAKENEPIPF